MMPHGHCLIWNMPLLSAHVGSDLAIAGAYYVIPIVLWTVRRWLRDNVGRRVITLFALFICACGTTHVMDAVVIWEPAYWTQAVVKMTTAALSVWTGVELIVLLRRVPRLA